MRSGLLLLLLCLLLLAACDNDNPPMVAPKGSPNFFRNDLGQTAYVNILYTAGQPGINFTKMSLLRQITVPAGATVPIGDSLMQPDKLYLLDWHSADYTYGNFTMRLPQNYKPFNHYPLVSDSTVILNGNANLCRLYCLDGDGKATHWQSVNAYNAAGTSVWDTLKGAKYHSIYMDIVGQYLDTARVLPGHGSFSKDDLVNTHFFTIEGSMVQIKANDYTLTNDLRPIAPLYTTSPDSLYLVRFKPGGVPPYPHQPPFFLIVKTQTIPLK